jgi:hypothetical protein
MNLLGNQRPNGCVNTALGLTINRIGGAIMADAINSDSVEIWKPIPGWEGLYEVCAETQEIRSVTRIIGQHRRGRGFPRTQQGKILRPVSMANGYLAYSLRKDGKSKWVNLHAAVCFAAHGPKPTPQHRVRHLDGDPLNNRPENLRWGTQRENCQDTVRHGRSTRGEKNSQTVLSESDVIEIRRRCSRGETQGVVSRDFNVCQGTVSAIVCGRSWQWLKAS